MPSRHPAPVRVFDEHDPARLAACAQAALGRDFGGQVHRRQLPGGGITLSYEAPGEPGWEVVVAPVSPTEAQVEIRSGSFSRGSAPDLDRIWSVFQACDV